MDPTRKSSTRVIETLIAFEKAWRAGKRPRPGVYVEALPEDEQTEAWNALLELEERLASEQRSKQSLHDSASGSSPLTATIQFTTPPQTMQATQIDTGPQSPPGDKSANNEIGDTFGHYKIVEPVGKGAMASVYRAIDTRLDRDVALKIPHQSARESAELIERFKREARAVAQLHHPNICAVYDAGELDGVPYMAMQFVSGMTLADYMKKRKASEAQTGTIVRRIARGLAHAHKAGVIHRDLKPANIMLNKSSEVIVMDFGLAANLESNDPRLTQAGMTLGSPAYMSPEQVEGKRELIGPQSDVFSLGLITFELLTATKPFDGNPISIMAQIAGSDVPPPSTLRDNLSPRLDEITVRMTRRDRAVRYETMNDVIKDLNEFLLEKKRRR